MKRKLQCIMLSCVLYVFVCNTSHAQVIINHTNIAGHGEKVYTAAAYSFIPSTVTAGNTGGSQFWDFSTLVAEYNDSILFYHADSTAYNGYFPSANLAINGGPNNFDYYLNDTSGLYQLGYGGDLYSIGQTCATSFAPPYKLMVWPATYGQSIADTMDFFLPPCPSSLNNDSVAFHFYYTYQLTADAWGTMQLPSGSYDCVRFSRTLNYIDTVWSYYNGNPWSILYTANGSSQQYEWWSNDPAIRYQLASLTMDTVNNVASYVSWIEAGGTTTSLKKNSAEGILNFYPNPASCEITVSFSKFKKADLVIYDLTGQKIKTFSNISSGQTILLNLEAGLYSASLFTEGEITGTSKLVVTGSRE